MMWTILFWELENKKKKGCTKKRENTKNVTIFILNHKLFAPLNRVIALFALSCIY